MIENKLYIFPVDQTYEYDILCDTYYRPAERHIEDFKYIALHHKGYTSYIGEVKDSCIVEIINGEITYSKDIDEKFKKNIKTMIDLICDKDRTENEYLHAYPNIFYKVDKFIKLNNYRRYTLQKTISKDIDTLIGEDISNHSIEEIAKLLENKI